MKPNLPPVLITFALVCFALVQNTQAVSPAPDGGYPGFNTAEGQNALFGLTTGYYNTALGAFTLFGDTTGSGNTAVGINVLRNNVTGGFNTAVGLNALFENTGTNNSALGSYALFSNTTGQGNIALGTSAGINLTTGNNNIDIGNVGLAGESNTIRIGDAAIQEAIFVAGIAATPAAAPNQAVLVNPTTGQLGSTDIASFGVVSTSPENTAVGEEALVSNTGGNNTATGFRALFTNTSASNNTAVGAEALLSNNVGNNSAVGAFALSSNSTGQFNNSFGANSLSFNTDGTSNNALSESALFNNINASANTAIGDVALGNNDSSGAGLGAANTAVGAGALFSNVDGASNNAIGFTALSNNTTGDGNIAIGDSAGENVTTADNVICIGASVAGANVSNSCYIGSIFGQTSSGGTAAFINPDGKLGTATSSRRFKEEIKPMERASEVLFALKPVTFRYKKEIDPQGIYQFGLVAEDVEAVNPELVVRDKEGKVNTVRYEAVNAMLLNEFLKEHRKNEQQEKTIAELKSGMTALAATVKEQAAKIQKVNAQLETSKPAPQVVANDR